MRNPRISKLKRHAARARELSDRNRTSAAHPKESDLIAKIRRDREAIWESKIAVRS